MTENLTSGGLREYSRHRKALGLPGSHTVVARHFNSGALDRAKLPTGKLDFAAADKCWRENVQSPAAKPAPAHAVDAGPGETLIAAQTRKEIALANIREIEFRQREGELIPLAEARSAWTTIIGIFRNKLSSVPNANCGRLAAITNRQEMRQVLMGLMDELANSLADDFQQQAIASTDDIGGDDNSAEDQQEAR